MTATYHPSVQRDVNRILKYYQNISGRLADEFWEELLGCIAAAAQNPERFHFGEEGASSSQSSKVSLSYFVSGVNRQNSRNGRPT
jgi:hypothetical protein